MKIIINEDTYKKIIDIKRSGTYKKYIPLSFNLPTISKSKISEKILLAMSNNTIGMFSLADDIEEITGIKKVDAEKYTEIPTDALVYGMSNVCNGGQDIFFWTNGGRLSGEIESVGVFRAITEHLSHECVHLSKLILKRILYPNDEEWFKKDLIVSDEKKIITDEETFATIEGQLTEQLITPFMNMAAKYNKQVRNLL